MTDHRTKDELCPACEGRPAPGNNPCYVCGYGTRTSNTNTPTDTDRLDFIERYLERSGTIQREGTVEIVRAWQVVTASTGDLRETIDLMMQQRGRLTNG